ncbi:MAG: Flp pilus assembly protein CpaB [Candidatus Omnitrophota bacterium]
METRKKGIFILAIASVLGLMASMMSVAVLNQGKKDVKTTAISNVKVEMKEVLVAARDLTRGTVFSREDLRLADWPKQMVPPTAFSQPEEVVGKIVKTEIFAEELITAQRVSSEDDSKGLDAIISHGMRAMTLGIDASVGASGFVHTGSKVDIVVTAQPKGTQGRQTKLVLQDIEVLAVEEESGSSQRMQSTFITLAISPENAEKLALSLDEGEIHIIVRNASDKEEVLTPGISAEELLETKTINLTQAAGAAQEVKFKVVELIVGESRTEEKFQQ